jgi:hypothetical protein
MPISRTDFDSLATVVDWLDACRAGELSALLALYDDHATLECECENVSLQGRSALSAYWYPKLETAVHSAFSLDEMTLVDDGVCVDYRSYDGNPVRITFRFTETGKIIYTRCGAIGCVAKIR